MTEPPKPEAAPAELPPPPAILVQAPPPRRGTYWLTRLLAVGLVVSLLFNLAVYSTYKEYYSNVEPPLEKYRSGSKLATDRIVVLEVNGTIMPPLTERVLDRIKKAKEDDRVKGVLLAVDSPGGLVADSHEIYHRLKELSAQKPVYVQMKRLAASGGYYIAMGGGTDGRIFAEPTTWTGSIGVILPRFDLSQLADKIGVVSDPI
jgi:protease-4